MKDSIPVWIYPVASTLLCALAAVIVTGFYNVWAWIFAGILVGTCGVFALLVKNQRPQVFRRRLSNSNGLPNLTANWMGVCAISVTLSGFSAYDNLQQLSPVMPEFLSYIGMVFLLVGGLILSQAANALAPHAQEYYGEPNPDHKATGVYLLVRHPTQLSVLILCLGIPLYFRSLYGLIGTVLQLLLLVSLIRKQEDFRFENYNWFYDYRKEVPYRFVPFLW